LGLLHDVHVDASLHAAQLASHAAQASGSATVSAKKPAPQLPLATQLPSLRK
jgi:hypothetical protein